MEKNERTFDNFNEFAENYREIHKKAISISGADSNYFSEYKIIELLKYENPINPLTILDFGCGDGNSSIYFRKYFPNATIYGIDVSEESILQAQKKNISNAIFSVFDGFIIPFEESKFDIVFSSMVFHHIQHRMHKSILEEIRRILKIGGRFYNFEHNPKNPLTRKVVRECVFDKDAILLNSKYHKNIVIESGLTLIKINFTIFFPRHRLFRALHFLEKRLTWCPFGAQYYIHSIKK